MHFVDINEAFVGLFARPRDVENDAALMGQRSRSRETSPKPAGASNRGAFREALGGNRQSVSIAA